MIGAQNTSFESIRKLSNSLFPIRLHVHAATVVYCIHENRQTELVILADNIHRPIKKPLVVGP